jgi:protein TonB
MRLFAAAVLTLCMHAGLFWVEMPWSRPTLIAPQSRVVSIDLVAIQKANEKASPQKPKVIIPETKTRPVEKPKPVVKSVIKFTPAHRPVSAVPLPDAVETTPAIDSDPDPQAVANKFEVVTTKESPVNDIDDQATVRASVPRYDLNPPPHYPRMARRRNYQGTVVLDVRVTLDGRVARVRIAKSSGYSVLDKSAVKSVKGWHFTPAMQGGKPFEMWVRVPVRYELQ